MTKQMKQDPLKYILFLSIYTRQYDDKSNTFIVTFNELKTFHSLDVCKVTQKENHFQIKIRSTTDVLTNDTRKWIDECSTVSLATHSRHQLRTTFYVM